MSLLTVHHIGYLVKKIEKAKEKSEIEKLIYELRYYKKILPIVELEKEKNYIQKELIRKSMQRKNTNKIKWKWKNKLWNIKTNIWNKNNRLRYNSIYVKI